MRGYLLTILVVLLAAACPAQDATIPPETKPVPETFFSGAVIAVSTTEITIRRRALISNATTKTFAMDAETKIEGKLRVKANVTVRYVTGDDGNARATRIIVR